MSHIRQINKDYLKYAIDTLERDLVCVDLKLRMPRDADDRAVDLRTAAAPGVNVLDIVALRTENKMTGVFEALAAPYEWNLCRLRHQAPGSVPCGTCYGHVRYSGAAYTDGGRENGRYYGFFRLPFTEVAMHLKNVLYPYKVIVSIPQVNDYQTALEYAVYELIIKPEL